MPLYLPFLEDAAASLVAALVAHEGFLAAKEGERPARAVAAALIDLHTAVDKGLKHSVCGINAGLLLDKLTTEKLHDLYLSQRATGAPSPFAQRKQFETPNLVAVANLARQLLGKSIPPEVWDQFADACSELRELRNLALHGELFGDEALLMGVLNRTLSRYRPVMSVICPPVLDRAYALNGQVESRLKGIEAETDGAWQVLVDYLAPGRELDVPAQVFLVLRPGQTAVDVLVTAESLVGSKFSVVGAAPLSERAGVFGLMVPEDQARVWRAPEPPPPTAELRGILEVVMSSSRAQLRMGAEGLLAAQAGKLDLPKAAGWAFLDLEGAKPKGLSVPVTLLDGCFEVAQDSEDIAFGGRLGPGRVLNPQRAAANAQFKGTLKMTSELAMTEDREPWPKGSALRLLVGDVKLSAQSKPIAA